MLKKYLSIFLILILNLVVFSQKKSDLQERSIKGKVHQINYYDVYSHPNFSEVNSTERYLSSIDVFNQAGNLRVQFEFLGSGKEFYYNKTVYSYDQKGREKSAVLYRSDKSETSYVTTPPLFEENRPENIAGKIFFVEEKTYEYDRKGRISREVVIDKEGMIVQENKYEYNRQGENTRYTIAQQKNRISGSSNLPVKTLDLHMSYRDKGKIKETYRYEDEKLIYKVIGYTDEQKRAIKEEQYNLETDAQNNITKETPSSLSKTYYEGDKEILDWIIYDKSGNLRTRLYILSKNENELIRLEYTRRSALEETNQISAERLTHYRFDHARAEINQQLKYILKFDQSVESPDWFPARFETQFYKFDARGNIIQSVTLQQDSPTKENKNESIREQDLIYYQ